MGTDGSSLKFLRLMTLYILAGFGGGYVGSKIADSIIAKMDGNQEDQNGSHETIVEVISNINSDGDMSSHTSEEHVTIDYSRISTKEKQPIADVIAKYSGEEKNGIYVITAEEYASGGHDHINVSFYQEDDVFSNEEDDVIESPKVLLGNNGYKFGEQNDDPDVVYIRNEKLGTDFEVIRIRDSYKHAILGEEKPVVEPEKPPKTSRPRVRKEVKKDEESED